MNITKAMYFCISLLSLVSLNGCLANKILDSQSLKLTKKYQIITKYTAYMDSRQGLHLCVNILKEGSNEIFTVKQHIPRRNFEIHDLRLLLGVGPNEYLLNSHEYDMGCDVSADFTPILITMIDVDQTSANFTQYRDIISRLPARNTIYTLYQLNSNGFDVNTAKCDNDNCSKNLSYTWPRLVIKTKQKKHQYKISMSILAAHTGERQAINSAQRATATAIDIVTFPVQIIFVGGYLLFGAQ